MAELRQQFRPEFLNRVDDTVLFKPLTEDELAKIVDLQVVELRARLAERRVKLELTAAAKRFAAHNGYDPVYGARPLKRFLQQELETPIARLLLSEGPVEGATIAVDVKDERLTVQLVPPPAAAPAEGSAPAEVSVPAEVSAPAEGSAPRKKNRK